MKILPRFGEGIAPALLLEYSLAVNQANYPQMLTTILGIGFAGLLALIVGSWFV